jgi:resuscitation-promoting factor RpfB
MRSFLLKTLCPLVMVLAGLVLIFLGPRPLTVQVDGQTQVIQAAGLMVGKALRSAGFSYTTADRITPNPDSLLLSTRAVVIDHARSVVMLGGEDGFWSLDKIPANWLLYSGVRLFPGDRVTWNGERIDPARPIQDSLQYALEYHPAQAVEIQSDGQPLQFSSAASTLGGALLENDFQLRRSDRMTGIFNQLLDHPASLVVKTARPVSLAVDGITRRGLSAGATVGQALADLGVSLQGLDYSNPPEEYPLPEDGEIQVVRVREEIVLQETSLPYDSSLQPDPELELDQRNVMATGIQGLKVTRQRVRFEDGQEISRSIEAEWIARQPQDEVLGYGTRVVVRTISTAEGTFEYWRAVNVYATAYSPCQLGIPNYCNSVTASGAQLTRGIVAVRLSWYRYMKGAGVYIPGYGTGIVADVGGGIPGKYWIDLGFTDADFQAWHQNTTIYFLTPVPANILYILPY